MCLSSHGAGRPITTPDDKWGIAPFPPRPHIARARANSAPARILPRRRVPLCDERPMHDTLKTRSQLQVGSKSYAYYSLPKAALVLGDVSRLP